MSEPMIMGEIARICRDGIYFVEIVAADTRLEWGPFDSADEADEFCAKIGKTVVEKCGAIDVPGGLPN